MCYIFFVLSIFLLLINISLSEYYLSYTQWNNYQPIDWFKVENLLLPWDVSVYIGSHPDEGVLTPEIPLNLRVVMFIRLRHALIVGGWVRGSQMYACCDQKSFCLLINMVFLQKYPVIATHCPLTFHGCEIFFRSLPTPCIYWLLTETLVYKALWFIQFTELRSVTLLLYSRRLILQFTAYFGEED